MWTRTTLPSAPPRSTLKLQVYMDQFPSGGKNPPRNWLTPSHSAKEKKTTSKRREDWDTMATEAHTQRSDHLLGRISKPPVPPWGTKGSRVGHLREEPPTQLALKISGARTQDTRGLWQHEGQFFKEGSDLPAPGPSADAAVRRAAWLYLKETHHLLSRVGLRGRGCWDILQGLVGAISLPSLAFLKPEGGTFIFFLSWVFVFFF